MPKSKNNRKGKKRVGDKRPVARSGRNEGPADYRTAKPIDESNTQAIQTSNTAKRTYEINQQII